MQQRGFTLVELSIVLVIIGLLVGGVLTGQSLIRAAELRSVVSQHDRYIAAIQTFRDKYFALPGDMTNAAKYWGAADGSDGNQTSCLTTASTTTATCNGDGNGQISNSGTTSNESFRFWQHLANAGLIEGSYDGITHGSSTFSATTANSPSGRIASSLWYAQYFGAVSGDGARFDGQYDNVLEIGALYTNKDPYNPIFKPEDAYNLDMKMDDGKPATGRIVTRQAGGWTGAICTDATASTTLTANYLLSSSVIGCALNFRQAF